jgi:hypothetical protein
MEPIPTGQVLHQRDGDVVVDVEARDAWDRQVENVSSGAGSRSRL